MTTRMIQLTIAAGQATLWALAAHALAGPVGAAATFLLVTALCMGTLALLEAAR